MSKQKLLVILAFVIIVLNGMDLDEKNTAEREEEVAAELAEEAAAAVATVEEMAVDVNNYVIGFWINEDEVIREMELLY